MENLGSQGQSIHAISERGHRIECDLEVSKTKPYKAFTYGKAKNRYTTLQEAKDSYDKTYEWTPWK